MSEQIEIKIDELCKVIKEVVNKSYFGPTFKIVYDLSEQELTWIQEDDNRTTSGYLYVISFDINDLTDDEDDLEVEKLELCEWLKSRIIDELYEIERHSFLNNNDYLKITY